MGEGGDGGGDGVLEGMGEGDGVWEGMGEGGDEVWEGIVSGNMAYTRGLNQDTAITQLHTCGCGHTLDVGMT